MNVLVIPPKFGSYNVRNTVPVSPGFCELGISSPQYADTDEVASTNNEGSVRGDILEDKSTQRVILQSCSVSFFCSFLN